MPALSWADKARGLSASRSGGADHIVSRKTDTAPSHTGLKGEKKYRHYIEDRTSVLPRGLEPNMWDLVCSYLNVQDVKKLSGTCRFLWELLRPRDNVWRVQLDYFREDMKNLYGEGRLLCTELFVPPSCSAYEQMKLELQLYIMDTHREWQLKDREKTDGPYGMFSFPLTLAHDPSINEEGWQDEDVTPFSQLRIIRAVRLFPSGLSTSQSLRHNGGSGSIFTPSEYMMLCENINHGDFTGSRLGVQDHVDEEGGLLQFALMETLRRAKYRKPPRCSTGEVRTSSHLVLRHFGGLLLSICRYEAEDILDSLLHKRGLVDDFVTYCNYRERSTTNRPCFPFPCQSRYYIAPELCRRGRVGLIITDSVRLLVVVGKELVTRDDARWGSDFAAAAAAGRTVYGGGMNPQQPRLV